MRACWYNSPKALGLCTVDQVVRSPDGCPAGEKLCANKEDCSVGGACSSELGALQEAAVVNGPPLMQVCSPRIV
jgi:hypothetical protein